MLAEKWDLSIMRFKNHCSKWSGNNDLSPQHLLLRLPFSGSLCNLHNLGEVTVLRQGVPGS